MFDAEWASPPDPAAAPTLAELLGRLFDKTAFAADQAAVAGPPPGARGGADRDGEDARRHLPPSFRSRQAGRASRSVTSFFRADPEVERWFSWPRGLVQPGPLPPLLSDLLTDDALIDTVGDPPVPPAIAAGDFPDSSAPSGCSTSCSRSWPRWPRPDDLDWLLDDAGELGWLQLDAIPYRPGMTPCPTRLGPTHARTLALFKAFPPTPDPADPEGASSSAARSISCCRGPVRPAPNGSTRSCC